MIIYLHGFNSGGYSEKAKFLEDLFPNNRFCHPTYDCHKVVESMAALQMLVDRNDEPELMFIGTSMGGWYAHELAKIYNAKSVLINPTTIPSQSLTKYLGKNKNFVTNEEYVLTNEHINEFSHYENDDVSQNGTVVLLDKGDKVLDYSVAESKFVDAGLVKVFEGGSHRFDHMKESEKLIMNLWNRFTL